MIINNTTDIPMTLVQIAIRHALDNLPDGGKGIELSEVIVKNKADGKLHGQHGWYFWHEKRVIIIVPRKIEGTYTVKLRHAYQKIHYHSRVDFLIAVMAHEIRHAYQSQVSHYFQSYKDRSHKFYRERDAEIYQAYALLEWHDKIAGKIQPKAASGDHV